MSPLSDLGQVRRLDGARLAPSWRLGQREERAFLRQKGPDFLVSPVSKTLFEAFTKRIILSQKPNGFNEAASDGTGKLSLLRSREMFGYLSAL
jgi:hypothetical protein